MLGRKALIIAGFLAAVVALAAGVLALVFILTDAYDDRAGGSARQTASREISKRLESEWDVQAENGYILGTPEEMAETLQRYVDIGVTNFVIDPACAPADMLEMFEVFAKEVIPHFRTGDNS